jgi:hypothetical protein
MVHPQGWTVRLNALETGTGVMAFDQISPLLALREVSISAGYANKIYGEFICTCLP